MAKERTAGEVVLALEHKLEYLEGMIKSIDHNVKLLLNKQNAAVARLVAASPEAPFQVLSQGATVEVADKLKTSGGRVVQERLTYIDSKPIILAQVEIFGMDGKLIDKRKTNNAGKWTTSLFPGKYMIRVAKPATSIKPSVTGQYEIIVEKGDKPYSLDTRKLGN